MPCFEIIHRAFKPLLTFIVGPILLISLPWHFTCKLKALAICQETSSTPHWATTHAHMSSSCSFMCLEQAKLGKSGEPCSAARCMQNGGICRTASQPCACWPCKMAEALRASYACPLYSAFQLGQGSPACIRSLLCPWPSCLREGGREGGRGQILCSGPGS